jgi:tetratricopeptide (TPR) repeat protein
MEIDVLKSAINKSSELSKRGQGQKALELLDDSIAEAIRTNRSVWVRVLSRHAAAISDSIGDLRLVKHYADQSLAYGSDDPAALYSLADALFQEGQTDLAKQCALKSYELSMQQDTEQGRALIELIIKRWPEVREGAK